MSTETLDRGLGVLRSATMSLESDPQYQLMVAEKQKLLASRHSQYMEPQYRMILSPSHHQLPTQALQEARQLAARSQPPAAPAEVIEIHETQDPCFLEVPNPMWLKVRPS